MEFREVYLDTAATTYTSKGVVEKMLPYFNEEYGNPGSKYLLGRNAKRAVDKARAQVAKLINAEPEQIIFTSGGSEANNLALKYAKDIGTFVCSNVEHHSVFKYCNNFHKMLGTPMLNVNSQCVITEDEIASKFKILDQRLSRTLVSTMYVNNETGAVNDIKMISRYCKEHKALLLVDCVQALSCVPVDVKELECDFASFSSHKIHGPKGVGCLYIRDPELLGYKFDGATDTEYMIDGGSAQEFGMRAGTENVPGIVGFGEAARILYNERDTMLKNIKTSSEYFRKVLSEKLSPSRYRINCEEFNNDKTLSITFFGVDSETLLMYLDTNGVYISAGSACTSHETIPSHVLKAIGLSDEEAFCTVRISFDWDYPSITSLDYAIDKIVEGVMMLNPGK